MKRRRIKHGSTLEERLSEQARKLKEKASNMRPGPEREALLKKARQTETAAHLNDWLTSPGLMPPE